MFRYRQYKCKNFDNNKLIELEDPLDKSGLDILGIAKNRRSGEHILQLKPRKIIVSERTTERRWFSISK